ncbi:MULTISPECIES: amino acid ABC transporter substrate-binding protein [unclassified Streptomyces]|uniref:amino acid ABC transporter substrate-binding protein n=1 Tax=unclassified Streptomyces TaxID=2593676 RepID=UPI0013D968C5|nr:MULTISPECIES: amino acid ABC transporter substrate-binding protein [unclassified Streptomyces]NMI54315.1 ABC transporter substrate-binding protein [Streptomyces sp. RLA2-12]
MSEQAGFRVCPDPSSLPAPHQGRRTFGGLSAHRPVCPWYEREFTVTPAIRRNLASSACILATLLTASCSTNPATGAAGAGSGSHQPLRIGISLSMTGDFGDTARAAKRGYQLWADQVNKSGGILGRQVQLKIVDDASSSTQVVTNYQNLISRDHVDLVFGPVSSLLTVPAARVAARYGYAFIESAGGAPTVFALHLHNLFLAQPSPVAELGVSFCDYILSLPADRRPRTVAYSSVDNPFATSVVDTMRRRLQAAGITTVLNQTYPSEQADVGPTVSRIVATRPDMVIAGTQGEDAYETVRAMIQQRFNPKWLFMPNDANDPVNFPDKAGKGNVAGIFTSNDWSPLVNRTGNQQFVKEYLAKFGGSADTIDASSAEAYAAGQILQAVTEKTGKADNTTIISALHSMTVQTVEGSLSWDSDGATSGHDNMLEEWTNGRLLPVYPSNTAVHAPLIPKPAWGG